MQYLLKGIYYLLNLPSARGVRSDRMRVSPGNRAGSDDAFIRPLRASIRDGFAMPGAGRPAWSFREDGENAYFVFAGVLNFGPK